MGDPYTITQDLTPQLIQDLTPIISVWTKSADEIVQKVNRGKAMLETLH